MDLPERRLEGKLDMEDRHLVEQNYKRLAQCDLGQNELVNILNRIFAKEKVEEAFKGSMCPLLAGLPRLCMASLSSLWSKAFDSFLDSLAHL